VGTQPIDAYCREIETYLCQKNDGHLIRVVGPSFEVVSGWAEQGVPLKIALAGIDRYFERYYRKGPRRRPVKIDFCDADVLDVFDEWRRAIGVPAASPDGAGDEPAAARRHASLSAHLDRVVARLTALRASSGANLGEMVDSLVTELDAARASAKGLRGEARRQLLDRLQALDARLLASMRARLDAATMAGVTAEADAELAPFRDRMPADAYGRAQAACIDRLVRERFSLPVVAFE